MPSREELGIVIGRHKPSIVSYSKNTEEAYERTKPSIDGGLWVRGTNGTQQEGVDVFDSSFASFQSLEQLTSDKKAVCGERETIAGITMHELGTQYEVDEANDGDEVVFEGLLPFMRNPTRHMISGANAIKSVKVGGVRG